MNPQDLDIICREIIDLFFSLPEDKRSISKIKTQICKEHHFPVVPKNSLILSYTKPDERNALLPELRVKPSRTLSGVAPIAVMTSPHPCPHGICLPCPGGPDHQFNSPQSYTGEEPAAKRGREHEYNPYSQTISRISQFEKLGHAIDKAELIIMGGTITARPVEYQDWFIGECIRAMNLYPGSDIRENLTLYELFEANEKAEVRCVAITFETRPDYAKPDHIKKMLSLGVTKVELGVQHTDDNILLFNKRGCGTNEVIRANMDLRNAGLKVGFHVMPNLPGSNIEKDERMFQELFSNPGFKPDFIKIYPTLVTPGSGIEGLYREGKYFPYPENDLINLVAYGKSILPRYVRLQRVQRDIPANLIVAGSPHGNFRELAKERLNSIGKQCKCIRCREIGRLPSDEPAILHVLEYQCCNATERFISYDAGKSLIGFVRIRTGHTTGVKPIDRSALIRELHVYGMMVPIGEKGSAEELQHKQFGALLLQKAEEVAFDEGYKYTRIMSGVGVRPYYRRHGYELNNPYMEKKLS